MPESNARQVPRKERKDLMRWSSRSELLQREKATESLIKIQMAARLRPKKREHRSRGKNTGTKG